MMVYNIFQTLSLGLTIYLYGMIIYIFMSWFPGARESAFGQVLSRIYEPYLEFFRRIIPPLGMIDLSPLVALILLNIANRGLWQVYQTFFL